MVRKLMLFSLVTLFGWTAVGCAVATVRVRQKDGTYKTSKRIVWYSPDDYREFECQEDYMVASEMAGVTYEWPKGRGRLEDVETTTFEGQNLKCKVHKRTLTVNGRSYGKFKEGDRVRITGDASVFVNDVERPVPDAT